jgi:hypothetical protein
MCRLEELSYAVKYNSAIARKLQDSALQIQQEKNTW